MGPKDKQLPFRKFPGHYVAPEECTASKVPVYCNYLQSMEGNIDSAHISFLHRNFIDFEPYADETDQPGYPSLRMSNHIRGTSRAPRIEVEETEWGFRYAAIRHTP